MSKYQINEYSKNAAVNQVSIWKALFHAVITFAVVAAIGVILAWRG